MSSSKQLSRQQLQDVLQAESLEKISVAQLIRFFQEEPEIAKFLPDGLCQVDPRNGERILFNSARARRPHDNQPKKKDSPSEEKKCVICQGHTTGVVDVADLSTGFTFINKNLYPVIYPSTPEADLFFDQGENKFHPEALMSSGLHFLQWTSSYHDRDWHNMPLSDRVIVLQRLAVLEKKLLIDNPWHTDKKKTGFVSLIKNYGYLVGGSLQHGHQQIIFSNVMPRRIRDNERFEQQQGETFSSYMLRENPGSLLLRDYGTAQLLVPYFMRRPFDMMLLLKDTNKSYLHQLDKAEMAAVADGWHDALRVIHWAMPHIGRELAYNVVSHTGVGAGLYFEFLPYTQEIGGAEQLGLFLSQGIPSEVASQIRDFLG